MCPSSRCRFECIITVTVLYVFNLKDCRQTGRVAVMVVLLGSLNQIVGTEGQILLDLISITSTENGDNVSNSGSSRSDIDLTQLDTNSAQYSALLTMPGPIPHRTPLRRVSQGSLFALSRSGAHPDAPHGLGFLEPALAELADEADALRANVDGLRALSASLDTFNEAFASWMYVMNMNALTVDWPEVREIGCNLLEIY